MSAGEQQEKQVVVTSCSPVFTGTQNGVEFRIYTVTATKPDGTPIDVPLRSFEELPLGECDVLVARFNSQQHGLSYTMSLKRSVRRENEELKLRVDELMERVSQLESRTGEKI